MTQTPTAADASIASVAAPLTVLPLPPNPLPSISLYGHSCEAMTELADGSVDLIVTSPPYWVSPDDPLMTPALLRDATERTPADYDALLALLSRCFAECFRVLKPGGIACVNVASTIVGERFYPLPYHIVPFLERVGFVMKESIIWRRWRGWDHRGGVVIQNPYPGYFRPNRIHEYVLIFEKPGPPIYKGRTPEEREASRIPIDALLFHEINSDLWNILPVQPLKRGKTTEGLRHPCPFPEELAYRLITLYSYKGDTVLDPFAGSGTTAKVARLTGRDFVGYEVNPAFLTLARERAEEETLVRQKKISRFVDVANILRGRNVQATTGTQRKRAGGSHV